MSTLPGNLGKFISEDAPWSEPVKWVIKWQFRLLGDFETALVGAIVRADESNLSKLSQGFPLQCAGYREWAYGDLARRLRAAGLDI